MITELNIAYGPESRAWAKFCKENIKILGDGRIRSANMVLADYCGKIRTNGTYPKVEFNTEQDKMFFILKWS